MLIVQVEPPSPATQGDQVYRTLQPCAALAALPGVHVESGCLLTPRLHAQMHAADVLVLCQAVDVELLAVLQARRRRQRPTVFEINDNFEAPHAAQPAAAFYRAAGSVALTRCLARHADGLQLCSDGLQRAFGHLNRRHLVLPNQLAAPPAAPPPRPATPLRVGWAGSAGHLDDIAWALPALRRLQARRPAVRLCFMAPRALHGLLHQLPGAEVRGAGDLPAYRAFLSSLHVGLAPLRPHPFNACRSDVKFVEMAAAGVAAACQRAPAYAGTVEDGVSGLLFGDLAELEAALTRLVDAPALRAALTARAHAQVRGGRLEAQHAGRRLAFYAALGAPCPSPAAAPGGYLQHRFGPLEQALYDGCLQPAGSAAAARHWEAARALAPRFYLPHLLLGRSRADAVGTAALRQAAALAPQACAPALALGERLAAAGERAAADAACRRAVALAPLLAAPPEPGPAGGGAAAAD